VSRADSRDRAIEGELRRHRVPPPSASSECLDAETLAAWADGGLGGDAHALAEVHIASCARCQSILATIVTGGDALEPAAADTRGAAWRRIDLRWLVPLTGAAAAVLLWAVAPDRGGEQQARLDDRRPQVLEQAPAAPPAAAAPSETPTQEPVAAAPSEEKLARVEPVRPPVDQTKGLEMRESLERARGEQERRQNSADLMAKAEAPARAVTGAAAAPAVSAEPNRAEADRPAAAPAPATQAFGAESRKSLARGSRIDLTSSTPGVRWRIANPGIVERSVDGGASWEPFDTGVRSTLAAGSCPSVTVCWVVGDAGVVLLTTDARTWRQVPRPTPTDLVAVDATDGGTAVVTTAAGQRFRTTDAGATWTRM
jgi:hypothetical protein